VLSFFHPRTHLSRKEEEKAERLWSKESLFPEGIAKRGKCCAERSGGDEKRSLKSFFERAGIIIYESAGKKKFFLARLQGKKILYRG